MNTTTFRLIPEKLKQVNDDWDAILNKLRLTQYQISEGEGEIIITYKNGEMSSRLIFPQKGNGDLQNDYGLGAQEILLEVQIDDESTINAIKIIAESLEYRFYSDHLQSFLPLALFYISFSKERDQKFIDLEQAWDMKFLFYDSIAKSYYARKISDGTMHLANTALCRYFLDFGLENNSTDEFSYVVADSLEEFVAFSNARLIPTNFYQYYKKPLKIINDSGFDIHSINRKVFIKPLIWELNSLKKEYYLLSNEGSSLVYMDKVLRGESLEDALKRILKEGLGIADDFIRARVLPDLEFDRDKEDALIPRLIVAVFVDKITDRGDIEKRARRTWNPLS